MLFPRVTVARGVIRQHFLQVRRLCWTSWWMRPGQVLRFQLLAPRSRGRVAAEDRGGGGDGLLNLG